MKSKTQFAAPPAPLLKPGAEAFVAGADTRQPAAPVPSQNNRPPAALGEAVQPPPKLVRVTVDFDSDLHRRLKIKALDETGLRDKSVSMADLLREWAEEKLQ